MSGRPTLSVKLDDGSGTFPYDITPWVHLPAGLGIRRGRQDEFETITPSELTLRLDNLDGRFTLGSPTYGIAVDQRIRVTATVGATTRDRFTGYVQDWPTTWPSPTASYAVAQITAIDRLSRLTRRDLRSVAENEIMVERPAAYYTLGEPADSTTAGDTSGNGRHVLAQAGTGAYATFGAASGTLADSLTAVQFSGGKYLQANYSKPLVAAGTARTIEGTFLTTGTSQALMSAGDTGPTDSKGYGNLVPRLELNAAGHVTWFVGPTGGFLSWSITSPAAYNDGTMHHFAAVYNPAGGVVRLYIDGTQVAGATGVGSGGNVDITLLALGYQLTGVMSHVAVHASELSAARIADHSAAVLSGFDGERSDLRIARLASYANVPTAEQNLETGKLLGTPPQAMAGVKVLDAMQAVMTGEGGALFVDGSGVLTMQNRRHRTLQATATPDLAITAADVEHSDLVITGDKQYLKNYITASRDQGATQAVSDQASIDQFEQYPDDLSTMLVSTDQQVLDAITWRVATYAQPRTRMSSLKLDLMTQTTAVQQAALNLDLGERLTISGMPAQSPSSTFDLIVEGSDEQFTESTWTLTCNTAPSANVQAWILGDATFGVLNSTTRLFY